MRESQEKKYCTGSFGVMRNAAKIIGFCLIGIGVSLIHSSPHAEVIDKIVAILDGELILLSEIREHMEKPVVQLIVNLTPADNFEEEALAYLLERHLLRQEIQYLAFPKEKDLTRSLAIDYIILTYNHEGLDQFYERMRANGISEAELEEELTLYMKGVDYIRRKFRFNADIDQPDVVLHLFQNWLKDLKAKTRIEKLP
ncbi:hypothetical protein CSA56_00185 [candidate division KSB3 bacterium]|uniref:Uncharacterized protein n=1 Tax=candidate division KSB3 bacterium TaxID=2044937 RepID=A0A2G6KLG7_9BACT|nr:MAG: hypothetical protein CSA56_00185 [candidate division KSB3 bacterium]